MSLAGAAPEGTTSAWPSITDYKSALQRIPEVFHAPYLQQSRVRLVDRYGIPKAPSGASAAVFRLDAGGRDVALRVYYRQEPAYWSDAQYGQLIPHLKAGPQPPCLVPIDYDRAGIFVLGDWRPILVMDWVDGQNLDGWIDAQVEKADRDALASAAEQWRATVRELKQARITHGDLQHGNILMVNNGFRLVDYDGLWLPAMGERTAPENGFDGYQHPERTNQPSSEYLDDFSAWMILLALQALAADLTLWEEFKLERDHEGLLFLKEDITDPDNSPVWPRLAASPDPNVRQLVEQVRTDIIRPFQQVTRFTADPYAALRVECRRPVPNWAELIRLATAAPRHGLPADLETRVGEAMQRARAEASLRAALGRRPADPRAVQLTFQERLFLDRPDCADLVRQARAALETVKQLDELRRLAGVGELSAVEAFLARLAPEVRALAEVANLEHRLSSLRQRAQAQAALLEALRAVPRSDRILAAAYRACADLGLPSLSAEQQNLCQKATERADCLDRLQTLPLHLDQNAHEYDRWWVEKWDDALLADCADAQPLRGSYEEAVQRLRTWTETEDALRQQDALSVRRVHGLAWLATYPPARLRWAEIERLAGQGDRIIRLRQALGRNDMVAIRAELEPDLAVLPLYLGVLDRSAEPVLRREAQRQQLLDVVRQAWQEVRLVRGQPALRAEKHHLAIELRWSAWTNTFAGRARRWWVAVRPRGFQVTPPDAAAGGYYQPCAMDCPDGAFRVPLLEDARLYVTVWPVLEVDAAWFGTPYLVGRAVNFGTLEVTRQPLRQAATRLSGVLGAVEHWLGLGD